VDHVDRNEDELKGAGADDESIQFLDPTIEVRKSFKEGPHLQRLIRLHRFAQAARIDG
jgi:hypothetical protein